MDPGCARMQNSSVNWAPSLRCPWDWQHRNTRGCSTVPGVPREMLRGCKASFILMGEGEGGEPQGVSGMRS